MTELQTVKSQRSAPAFVDVAQAKGRPMLTWVGKAAPERVPVLPAQCIETFEPTGHGSLPATNTLYHGDNKEILAHLLANGLRGKVRLIYIDPPFDSGADYVRQVRLRGSNHQRMAGRDYSLGEQVQYTDIWANDNYLQFMYERLPLLRELLAPNGTLWLHCDHRKAHHLRILLEEIFGSENYLNTIAWRSQVARGAKVNAFYFPYSTHWIEIFAKDRNAPPIWHAPTKKLYLTEAEAAKQYMQDEQGFFRTSDPGSYSFERLVELHNDGRLYAPFGGEIVIDVEQQQIYGSNGGSIAVKYYLNAEPNGRYSTEQVIDNLWDDIPGLATTPAEEVGYPTQKTEALLARIIEVSTDPGDLVLDCFMGSGTTVAVAQRLQRRWIGCDINHGSIQTVSRRLQRLITTQLQAEKDSPPETQVEDTTGIPISAWATFALYRINGYDLSLGDVGPSDNVQPMQAAMVQLAADVVGVRRIRSDPFFEGKMGARLVKFADFSRPLLVADLEAIAAEIAARSTMVQNIVVICLGRELATEEWLTQWNQHRMRGQITTSASAEQGLQGAPTQPQEQRNHIEIIELQSDLRYGSFFVHEPAQAELTIRRDPAETDTIEITIEEFLSPTIIQRLYQQSHVEPPTITDWRAMVESVAIDPAYNGKIFRAVSSDAPHKRTDVVQGSYRLQGIACPTTVAVKIIDMLGEELLITQHLK